MVMCPVRRHLVIDTSKTRFSTNVLKAEYKRVPFLRLCTFVTTHILLKWTYLVLAWICQETPPLTLMQSCLCEDPAVPQVSCFALVRQKKKRETWSGIGTLTRNRALWQAHRQMSWEWQGKRNTWSPKFMLQIQNVGYHILSRNVNRGTFAKLFVLQVWCKND